jgi:hypothetical protein
MLFKEQPLSEYLDVYDLAPTGDRPDRLLRMLERILAKIDVLNFAREELADVSGDILELGLGRGNSYDRLRTIFSDRRIYVFDTLINCAPDVVPPEEDTRVGDVLETLPAHTLKNGKTVALGHYDIGGYDQHENDQLATKTALLLKEIMVPGGLVISTSNMGEVDGWTSIPDRYTSNHEHFIYSVNFLNSHRG